MAQTRRRRRRGVRVVPPPVPVQGTPVSLPASLPLPGVEPTPSASRTTLPLTHYPLDEVPPIHQRACTHPPCQQTITMEDKECPYCKKKQPAPPKWYLAPDSHVRTRATKAYAMRALGVEDKEIAQVLGINVQSLHNDMYRAGKNGYLDFHSAKDAIEFGLMPKVIRNLEAALDDNARHRVSGMPVKTDVSMRIAEGTLFKKFDTATGQTQSTMIAIKVEMPPGPPQQMREGTVGGTPSFVEAQVVE